MYRTINFSTKDFDSLGREYFKPPTYAIAEKLKTVYLKDFRLKVIKDFTAVGVFIYPILQHGNLYCSEKLGEKRLLGYFYYDINTDKITLLQEFQKLDGKGVQISELLFSCLRPTDIVEVKTKEYFNNKCVLSDISYKSLKSNLLGLGKKKENEELDECLIFDKKLFSKKEIPIIKKRKLNYERKTTI